LTRKYRPHTPDSRYLVSGGLLKRCTNPALDDRTRRVALKQLMQARLAGDREAAIHAKTVLGETGAVWWADGAPDLSGLAPSETVYRDWWAALPVSERAAGEAKRKKKHLTRISTTVPVQI